MVGGWHQASHALDTIFGCAEVFAERLMAMTDGQFDIEFILRVNWQR